MSASASEVNTLLIEPISNTVSPSSGPSSSAARAPREMIRRPVSSITPTTMPTPCFSTSIRCARIAAMAASSGTRQPAMLH